MHGLWYTYFPIFKFLLLQCSKLQMAKAVVNNCMPSCVTTSCEQLQSGLQQSKLPLGLVSLLRPKLGTIQSKRHCSLSCDLKCTIRICLSWANMGKHEAHEYAQLQRSLFMWVNCELSLAVPHASTEQSYSILSGPGSHECLLWCILACFWALMALQPTFNPRSTHSKKL